MHLHSSGGSAAEYRRSPSAGLESALTSCSPDLRTDPPAGRFDGRSVASLKQAPAKRPALVASSRDGAGTSASTPIKVADPSADLRAMPRALSSRDNDGKQGPAALANPSSGATLEKPPLATTQRQQKVLDAARAARRGVDHRRLSKLIAGLDVGTTCAQRRHFFGELLVALKADGLTPQSIIPIVDGLEARKPRIGGKDVHAAARWRDELCDCFAAIASNGPGSMPALEAVSTLAAMAFLKHGASAVVACMRGVMQRADPWRVGLNGQLEQFMGPLRSVVLAPMRPELARELVPQIYRQMGGAAMPESSFDVLISSVCAPVDTVTGTGVFELTDETLADLKIVQVSLLALLGTSHSNEAAPTRASSVGVRAFNAILKLIKKRDHPLLLSALLVPLEHQVSGAGRRAMAAAVGLYLPRYEQCVLSLWQSCERDRIYGSNCSSVAQMIQALQGRDELFAGLFMALCMAHQRASDICASSQAPGPSASSSLKRLEAASDLPAAPAARPADAKGAPTPALPDAVPFATAEPAGLDEVLEHLASTNFEPDELASFMGSIDIDAYPASELPALVTRLIDGVRRAGQATRTGMRDGLVRRLVVQSRLGADEARPILQAVAGASGVTESQLLKPFPSSRWSPDRADVRAQLLKQDS